MSTVHCASTPHFTLSAAEAGPWVAVGGTSKPRGRRSQPLQGRAGGVVGAAEPSRHLGWAMGACAAVKAPFRSTSSLVRVGCGAPPPRPRSDSDPLRPSRSSLVRVSETVPGGRGGHCSGPRHRPPAGSCCRRRRGCGGAVVAARDAARLHTTKGTAGGRTRTAVALPPWPPAGLASAEILAQARRGRGDSQLSKIRTGGRKGAQPARRAADSAPFAASDWWPAAVVGLSRAVRSGCSAAARHLPPGRRGGRWRGAGALPAKVGEEGAASRGAAFVAVLMAHELADSDSGFDRGAEAQRGASAPGCGGPWAPNRCS